MPGGRGKTDDGTGGCREGAEAIENSFCEGDSWFCHCFRGPVPSRTGNVHVRVRFMKLLFRGHPGRIGSFLSLVPALFQDLFSGLEVLFARQGPFFGFALSDVSDPIRCNFNRDNPDNLHEAVQQRLRGKRIVHFGREQSVVGCQRDECVDDQHQGLRFPLPARISEVFPGDQN